MCVLIRKILSKSYLLKITFVSLIILENVIFKYKAKMLHSTNFITLLIELLSKPYFVYEILFISIFILTYDSISEVYLNNEISMKISRKKILLGKTLEFTFKYISVMIIVFVLCFIISIVSNEIIFSLSWDNNYIHNAFGNALITAIPALLVLLSMLFKYYFGALIVFLVGYYIYIVTSNPIKGVVGLIAVIISLITIGADASLLMVRGDKIMETIAKLTINYNMGMINYHNISSLHSFLVKELISFVYLLVLVLGIYIICENKLVKKDIL